MFGNMYVVQPRPNACEAAHRDWRERGVCAIGWLSTTGFVFFFKWPAAIPLQIYGAKSRKLRIICSS